MAEPSGNAGVGGGEDKQTFTFHLPDGKSASIGAPKGTTPEQAWGYLVQQHPEYNKQGGGSQQERLADPPEEGSFRAGAEDFLHGVNTGIAGDIVGAGQLARHVLPDSFTNWIANSRVGQRLSEAAQPPADQSWTNWGGSMFGAALPFAAMPGLGPTWGPAARVVTRSTLPAAVQPVPPNDPDYWGTKAVQTGIGTVAGEALQGLGSMGARALAHLKNTQAVKSLSDLVERINKEIRGENQAKQTQYETRRDRVNKFNQQVQSRNTALDQNYQQKVEAQKQQAYNERLAANAEEEKAKAAAAEVQQRNLARQQEVDRLNKRNEVEHQGARAQHAIDTVRQADMPRQAVQDILNDARGLIGQRPLEYDLNRGSAPELLRQVGGELDRIYRGMSFDPNQGGWLANAQKVQDEIAARLRQDPNAQALWDRVFQGKAFMPGLRAEAGAGEAVAGTAPATVRSPSGQVFRLRSGTPTGDVQGPMGTRSGPVSGQQLSMLMSNLTKAQQQFGLEAQRGGGAIYKNIADGLSQMRSSIEQQLDAKFPALAAQRQAANQAYFLTSRVMDAVDVHGMATPEALQKAFKAAEGDVRFGTDKRFADIKDRLEAQHQHYTTKLEPPKPPTVIKGYDEPVPKVTKPTPKPQAPIPRPGRKSEIPLPRRPVPIKEGEAPKPPAAPPPSPGGEAAKAVGRKIIAHGLGGLPGVIAEPFVTSAGRKLARSPTAAKVLSGARHLGMPAAIGASQAVTPGTDDIPEIVVRPKPGDRN